VTRPTTRAIIVARAGPFVSPCRAATGAGVTILEPGHLVSSIRRGPVNGNVLAPKSPGIRDPVGIAIVGEF